MKKAPHTENSIDGDCPDDAPRLKRMLVGECLRLRNPTLNVRSLHQITKYLADFLRWDFG